jgi:K(+)-stimulated pyrophosphate-energized sodium pump
MLGFVFIAALAALGFAALNFYAIKKKSAGTDKMQEIAGAIQAGAHTFLSLEYHVIIKIGLVIVLLLSLVVSWQAALAFVLGATMSASAGWIGMKIATLSNVRVSNEARQSGDLGATLKVAFQGGSVMGLCVAGFALFGLALVYLVFGRLLGQTAPENLVLASNWIGIRDIPFTMTVTSYALGCSIIAMFNRVGGGIYTKAADMGADLVGKTEAGIPEDDPRNPATIADNVGDNVGDVAGLGADILESFVGAMVSSAVLSSYIYFASTQSGEPLPFSLLHKLILFPLIFSSLGLFASMVGILMLVLKKGSPNPRRELNLSTWLSAFLTLILTGLFSYFYFDGEEVAAAGFNLGKLSPFIAALTGILSGVMIGQLADYYTSFDYKPTQNIAAASREGAALTVTQGLAVGMISVFFPVLVLSAAIITAHGVCGLYGVSMAAVGMLSFVATTVSVDTYGPIADNAGGISEMAELATEVRVITDKLDSVGNTTAAMGKGFAIGSAAFAALSLFASYLYALGGESITSESILVLNMINSMTLAGALVGAAIPYLFSGILIEAVTKAARLMVAEVRKQFKEKPGIMTGEEKADYQECIEISSTEAIREMRFPAIISVCVPLFSGFIFGVQFVGGLLIGTTLSSVMLALFAANGGGALDNGKKYIEKGHLGGKGSESHKAGVVGDTVGDPLKDTVGPSLNILIKIMSVVSLISVSIFGKYNIYDILF